MTTNTVPIFSFDGNKLMEYIYQQTRIPPDTREIEFSVSVDKFGNPGHSEYTMLHIAKQLDADCLISDTGRLCRSLVVDARTDEIISFSPGKSVPFAEFAGTTPIKFDSDNVHDSHHIQITDFIDGTMVNLCYNGCRWDISTKNKYSGNSRYCTNPLDKRFYTFRTMFFDIFGIQNTWSNEECNEHEFFRGLYTSRTYSFVLQHTDNEQCYAFPQPMVYLVAVYQKDKNNMIHCIPQEQFMADTPSYPFVFYPRIHTSMISNVIRSRCTTDSVSVWDGLTSEVQARSVLGCGPSRIGVSIMDFKTGNRTKIVFHEHTALVELRGHHPNHMVQYFDVLQSGRRQEFVDAFRRFGPMFHQYDQIFVHYIQSVYNWYVQFFCHKQRNVPKHYMSIIYRLHNEVYTPLLRQQGMQMSLPTVQSYLESVPIMEQYKNVMNHHRFMIGEMVVHVPVVGDDNV